MAVCISSVNSFILLASYCFIINISSNYSTVNSGYTLLHMVNIVVKEVLTSVLWFYYYSDSYLLGKMPNINPSAYLSILH